MSYISKVTRGGRLKTPEQYAADVARDKASSARGRRNWTRRVTKIEYVRRRFPEFTK